MATYASNSVPRDIKGRFANKHKSPATFDIKPAAEDNPIRQWLDANRWTNPLENKKRISTIDKVTTVLDAVREKDTNEQWVARRTQLVKDSIKVMQGVLPVSDDFLRNTLQLVEESGLPDEDTREVRDLIAQHLQR